MELRNFDDVVFDNIFSQKSQWIDGFQTVNSSMSMDVPDYYKTIGWDLAQLNGEETNKESFVTILMQKRKP